MSRSRWRSLAVSFVLLGACQKDPPPNPEAQIYADEGARLADEGARGLESAAAQELVLLFETRRSVRSRRDELLATPDAGDAKRLLDVEEKALARVEGKIVAQRKVAEANRDRLIAAKKATQALLADKKADAGVSRTVLEARLAGIGASLKETQAALDKEFADAG